MTFGEEEQAVRLMAVSARLDEDRIVIFSGRQSLAMCVECGQVSGPYWMRWRAVRIDEPDTDAEPEIALYCPQCAGREFGPERRRPLGERRRRPR